MSTFLIAKKKCVDWDLPVFCAGRRGDGDAIAIFTSQSRARHFLKVNRLEQNHQLGEVAACEFIEVVFAAFENDVDFIWINPATRDDASDSWRLLPIKAEMAKFAHRLTKQVIDRRSISQLN